MVEKWCIAQLLTPYFHPSILRARFPCCQGRWGSHPSCRPVEAALHPGLVVSLERQTAFRTCTHTYWLDGVPRPGGTLEKLEKPAPIAEEARALVLPEPLGKALGFSFCLFIHFYTRWACLDIRQAESWEPYTVTCRWRARNVPFLHDCLELVAPQWNISSGFFRLTIDKGSTICLTKLVMVVGVQLDRSSDWWSGRCYKTCEALWKTTLAPSINFWSNTEAHEPRDLTHLPQRQNATENLFFLWKWNHPLPAKPLFTACIHIL